MRRLKSTVLAIVPALVVALAGILTPGVASAAFAGYAASDVLGQLDFTTKTTGTTDTTLDYPSGTAIDTVHHRLFIGEYDNRRVLVYNLDADNNLIDHVADYVLGQPDFTSSNNTTTQSGLGCSYLGLAYDSQYNRLFVSDNCNHRVLVYNLATGVTNGMNASNVLGQPDFTSNSNATTQNGLTWPNDVVLDAANQRLFVNDNGNSRVMVFNVNPAAITNGENADYVIGQPDFTSSATVTTQNGMNREEDLAYNSTTQQLFVGDSNNYRVLIFDLSQGITNGMNASYVLGQPDFTTTSSANTTQNGFGDYQEGMGIDPTRNILYVSDDSNNRILIFNLSNGITNNMNASMVLGQPDFTTTAFTRGSGDPCWSSVSYQPTQVSICDPEASIAVDPVNNRIYATGSSDNRVLVFNFAKLASSLNDPAVGDSYSQWMGSQFQGTPTFSVVSGSLPPGLTLDASSGLLSGVFTQAGTFNFTIQLVDNNGTAGSFTDTHAYTLVVDPAVAAAGASTLSNTGMNTAISSGVAITILASATAIYRKRNHLYRLWGWQR